MRKPAGRYHTYKFGLYGYRSSGKTCILAALALRRLPHPDGIEIGWLENYAAANAPLIRPSSPFRRLVRVLAQPILARSLQARTEYELGDQWLNEACAAIKQGKLPKPNPDDQRRLRFSLTKASETRRDFEIIDYSGELVSTKGAEVELRRKIREHFRELDGFIILAEYPDNNQPHILDQITELISALSQLVDERKQGKLGDCPIIVIVNKWDKAQPSSTATLEAAQKRLAGLLKTDRFSGHLSLWNTVRSIAPYFHADRDRNAAQLLPVSALGNLNLDESTGSVGHSGQILPLKSFGLEDAFYALATQKDEIDADRLQHGISRMAVWRLWDFAGYFTLTPRPSQLLRRSPRSQAVLDLAKRAYRKSALVGFGQLAVLTGLALGAQQGWIAYSEYPHVQSYRSFAALKPAARSPETILPHERWLERYALNSNPYVRQAAYTFLLPRAKAIEAHAALRKEREDKTCERIRTAPSGTSTEAEAASAYIAAFPDGSCRRLAEVTVGRHALRQQIQSSQDLLNKAAIELSKLDADSTATAAHYTALFEHIKSITVKRAPDDSEYNDLDNQIKQILDFRIGQLEKARQGRIRAKCREHQYAMDQALSNGSLHVAASYYQILSNDCGDQAPTVQQFMERALSALEQFARRHINSNALKELVDKLRPASQSTALIAMDKQTKSGLLDRLNEVHLYATRVSERNLYNRLERAWRNWTPFHDRASRSQMEDLFTLYAENFDSGLKAHEVQSARRDFRRLTVGNQAILVNLVDMSACLLTYYGYQLELLVAGQRHRGGQLFGRRHGSWVWCDQISERWNSVETIEVPDLSGDVSIKLELTGGRNGTKLAGFSGSARLSDLRGGQTFTLVSKTSENNPVVRLNLADWPKKRAPLQEWNIELEPPKWLSR